MSSNAKIYPLVSKPGVKRDGTTFEGDYYNAGVWMRFQRNLPRKIGGYIQMGTAIQIARGCDVFTQNGIVYIHYGTESFLNQALTTVTTDQISTTNNRTPATEFSSDPDNLWQFGQMYDASSTTTNLIAHCAPNLTNIDNSSTGKIFLGDITSNAPLTPISASDVSGGIAILHPYLFYFGSNGLLGWSVPNEPSDLSGSGSGEGRVTGGKVLFGLQTRAGAGNAPAGLFWATDALIRATFSGSTTIFNFDRIATSYSIMSSQCVVEYDGQYYWIGTDRFLMYNGVIQEIPNELNRNYFFDNVSNNYRQKVWGMKIASYGEIWWFWVNTLTNPIATECNHVLIYNVHEQTWYDTPLARSCGYSAEIFPHPIMFDTALNTNGTVNIYKHEQGVDQVINGIPYAIQSYFETSSFFSQIPQAGNLPWNDYSLEMFRYEPDFVLSGIMTMQMIGRKYPQSVPVIIQEEEFDATTEKIDIRNQARITSFRFESNVTGGGYQMGTPLALVDAGDKRAAGSL